MGQFTTLLNQVWWKQKAEGQHLWNCSEPIIYISVLRSFFNYTNLKCKSPYRFTDFWALPLLVSFPRYSYSPFFFYKCVSLPTSDLSAYPTFVLVDRNAAWKTVCFLCTAVWSFFILSSSSLVNTTTIESRSDCLVENRSSGSSLKQDSCTSQW